MIYVCLPKNISEGVFFSQVRDKFAAQNIIFISFCKSLELDIGTTVFDVSSAPSGAQIYSRSIWDSLKLIAYSCLLRRRFQIWHDVRGLISEESRMRRGSRLRYYILRLIEGAVYKNVSKLSCVSKNMKAYLATHYQIRDVEVVPCKIKGNLIKQRKAALQAIPPLKIVYSGSISRWQCFDRVCELYSSLPRDSATLTVLTKDLVKAKQVLNEFSIKNYSLYSLRRDEVLEELDSFDFGFVLRENHVVNTTASPVKVAEYLARGVTPIMTEYVGDYSAQLFDCAYVLKDFSEPLDLSRLVRLREQHCLDLLHDSACSLKW